MECSAVLGCITNRDVMIAAATLMSFAVLLPGSIGGEENPLRGSTLGRWVFSFNLVAYWITLTLCIFHTLAAMISLLLSVAYTLWAYSWAARFQTRYADIEAIIRELSAVDHRKELRHAYLIKSVQDKARGGGAQARLSEYPRATTATPTGPPSFQQAPSDTTLPRRGKDTSSKAGPSPH